MRTLMVSGIAFVLLSAAAYAESPNDDECTFAVDEMVIRYEDPAQAQNGAVELALCNGCPCCDKRTFLKKGSCRCTGGDQCKYCCTWLKQEYLGQSPQPSCKCHRSGWKFYRARCGKSSECYPCNLGDVTAVVPEVFVTKDGTRL